MDVMTRKVFRQFSLLTWTSLIGLFVHPLEGEGRGWGKKVAGGNHYFSSLRVSLY